ncbi:hypothetical protein ElyMa_001546700 [Elysia marginata]|uniref:Uncharacterized protein n=1 Tax=Elysia marginata TaxID=1093978 RepID=A0AAV4JDP1_9GAST|nr:hypothetical protein ElyMa_001546700 [Elysia marginata]
MYVIKINLAAETRVLGTKKKVLPGRLRFEMCTSPATPMGSHLLPPASLTGLVLSQASWAKDAEADWRSSGWE